MTKGSNIKDILGSVESAADKLFGPGSAARLSSSDSLSKVDRWVSTGSLVVDQVIRGGRPHPCSLLPFGRITEISGKNGSGKSTLAAQVAARVQQMGGICVMLDSEDRADEKYMRNLGVNTDEIMNLHASSLEEAFEKQQWVIEEMNKQAPDVPLYLLWDSLGSLSSNAVVSPKKGDSFLDAAKKDMGRTAQIISHGVKIIHKACAETNTAVVYTNHVYNLIGVTFGPSVETPGGEKVKFMFSLRLQLASGKALKEEDQFGNQRVIGKQVHVQTLKNSMAPCLMKKTAYLLGGKGFYDPYTVRDVGKKMGWIETRGAWSTWYAPSGEEVKFQGDAGFREKVLIHPEYGDLESQVMEVF